MKMQYKAADISVTIFSPNHAAFRHSCSFYLIFRFSYFNIYSLISKLVCPEIQDTMVYNHIWHLILNKVYCFKSKTQHFFLQWL